MNKELIEDCFVFYSLRADRYHKTIAFVLQIYPALFFILDLYFMRIQFCIDYTLFFKNIFNKDYKSSHLF